MADMLTAAPEGAAFDTAYVNGQVTGHENTLAMLKDAADKARNADLQKMLTDAQKPVEQHLDRIEDIQGKMKCEPWRERRPESSRGSPQGGTSTGSVWMG